MELMQNKRKGEGRVYLDKGRDIWMIEWYSNGKRFRESSHSTDETEARKLLTQRIAGRDRGLHFNPIANRVKFSELAEDLIREYAINELPSLRTAEAKIRAFIIPYFGHLKASRITPEHIARYKELRMKDVTNGTINHDLALIKRIFKLGVENGKVIAANIPMMRGLKPPKPRTGFYEWWETVKLGEHLPEFAHNLPRFYFICGWRKMEVLILEWAQHDFNERIFWLTPEQTKSGQPRTFAYEAGSTIETIIKEQWKYKQRIEREQSIIVTRVFHDEGKPIHNLRWYWAKAHQDARLVFRTIHDLRRSSKRAYGLAGVTEHHSMQVLGHSNVQVARAYDVSDIVGIRQSTSALDAFVRQQGNGALNVLRPCPECGHLHNCAVKESIK